MNSTKFTFSKRSVILSCQIYFEFLVRFSISELKQQNLTTSLFCLTFLINFMVHHSVEFMCGTVLEELSANIGGQAPGNLSTVGGSINKFLRAITNTSLRSQSASQNRENPLYLNLICIG